MAIEFIGFTADSRIVGTIPLTDDRLSDMLNSVGRIVVRNASIEDIDLGPQEDGQAIVPTTELLIVVGTGRRGVDARRRRMQTRYVQIGLGRYTVSGDIHVGNDAYAASLEGHLEALLVGRDMLVPLTDAVVRYNRGGEKVSEEWDTILINRIAAQWIKPLDEDDEDEDDEDEVVEEGPIKTRYVKDFTGTVAE
jgi:hypothetical protein